jgi:hypothetical protein
MWSMAKASVDGSAWLEEETGGLAAAPKPRYRAEDLIYEAWQTAGPRRVKLARQAGVAAGERAAGRRVFAQNAGEFWLIFETRPYMRARAALAAMLWRLGRREEAVSPVEMTSL